MDFPFSKDTKAREAFSLLVFANKFLIRGAKLCHESSVSIKQDPQRFCGSKIFRNERPKRNEIRLKVEAIGLNRASFSRAWVWKRRCRFGTTYQDGIVLAGTVEWA
jgi:hypothetical protein